MKMANKKKSQKKPTQKKREIGVSYTDREGRRRYVYRSDFPTVDAYLDRAENIILFAKNPRTLHFRKKRKAK